MISATMKDNYIESKLEYILAEIKNEFSKSNASNKLFLDISKSLRSLVYHSNYLMNPFTYDIHSKTKNSLKLDDLLSEIFKLSLSLRKSIKRISGGKVKNVEKCYQRLLLKFQRNISRKINFYHSQSKESIIAPENFTFPQPKLIIMPLVHVNSFFNFQPVNQEFKFNSFL